MSVQYRGDIMSTVRGYLEYRWGYCVMINVCVCGGGGGGGGEGVS